VNSLAAGPAAGVAPVKNPQLGPRGRLDASHAPDDRVASRPSPAGLLLLHLHVGPWIAEFGKTL